uniref:Swi1p n=1 Tax=Ganoderma boninense TaxID=34458 RepID=A0A5K1K6X8_9APHY|nr:Swi1p [Ganoderma boninense]
MFLESCDITEVDASFEDIPVELPVVDITRAGSLEQKASFLPSRGGSETVIKALPIPSDHVLASSDSGSPSPVLPEPLNVSKPPSERCDWKIRGGTVGDWLKCPQRPPPAFEQHFNGSKFQLLETRRRDLDRTLRARAAKQIGVPIHMYARNTPFFEWPIPAGMD